MRKVTAIGEDWIFKYFSLVITIRKKIIRIIWFLLLQLIYRGNPTKIDKKVHFNVLIAIATNYHCNLQQIPQTRTFSQSISYLQKISRVTAYAWVVYFLFNSWGNIDPQATLCSMFEANYISWLTLFNQSSLNKASRRLEAELLSRLSSKKPRSIFPI